MLAHRKERERERERERVLAFPCKSERQSNITVCNARIENKHFMSQTAYLRERQLAFPSKCQAKSSVCNARKQTN